MLTAVQPEWLVRAMGSIFILLGGAIFFLGFKTSLRVSQELGEQDVETTSRWFLGVLTFLLVIVALIALVLVFL